MNSNSSFEDTCEARVQAVLLRASQLTAAERDTFLRERFAEDAELREHIYKQLINDLRSSSTNKHETKLNAVPLAVNRALDENSDDRKVNFIGKVLGDYRLTSEIGSGGTGTVYLAERADKAYSAQVAVKVLTNAQMPDEIKKRFAAERQILATLNHPYIARLLDGGETNVNDSFLVMEYVQGEPIDRYCDNQKLTIPQRLQLFIKVCQAVQYAHRNLVVHRDLKPGNILVSQDGTPKLLDFGIAKLLDNDTKNSTAEAPLHTRIQDRLLTPEYASPEQIRGQSVTTASDVYSLGIILYELLTGVRPYVASELNQLELERTICVVDPIKPSQMVARIISRNAATDVDCIATSRGLSPRRLTSKLEGDIDAIILRTLRKEPEKRYSSVEQLIEDVQRYLDHEPVIARQGNWTYYSNRFVRRHALGVTMSSIALVALMGFAIAHLINKSIKKDVAKDVDKN